MSKPHFGFVGFAAVLLGACWFSAPGRNPLPGSAAANDEWTRTLELGPIRKNQLERVDTEQEFKAVLRADRAVLFVWVMGPVDVAITQPVIEAWIRDCPPPAEVYRVAPYEQPYVYRWMV